MFLHKFALAGMLVLAAPAVAQEGVPGLLDDLATAKTLLAQEPAGYTIWYSHVQVKVPVHRRHHRKIRWKTVTHTVKHVDFKIRLAIKGPTGPVRTLLMEPNGANREGFHIEIGKDNGLNTPYRIIFPAGYSVLGNRRLIHANTPTGYDEGVYVPLTDSILRPEVEEAGYKYIMKKLAESDQGLARVYSHSVPGKLITDLVPDDMKLKLLFDEHMDHQLYLEEGASPLMYGILALYGANLGNTFMYAGSTAGAYGPMQFMPSTYRDMVRLYPEAHLDPDFVRGMRNLANAFTAAAVFLDYSLLKVPADRLGRLLSGEEDIHEFWAAFYNGGPKAVFTLCLPVGRRHHHIITECKVWRAHETDVYCAKLRDIAPVLDAIRKLFAA